MADTTSMRKVLVASFLARYESTNSTENGAERIQHDPDATAAASWAAAIYAAFYGAPATRGINKFAELEATLSDVFADISHSAVQEFWRFAVHVVLALAQELRQTSSLDDRSPFDVMEKQPMHDNSDKRETTAKKEKKKNKVLQSNAPLAFLVVNALKKLTEGEDKAHTEYCRHEGQTNAELRSFCINALETPQTVDQKLLVEILDLFQLTEMEETRIRRALDYLLDRKYHSAVIKLCSTFSNIDWSFKEIVKRLVHAKDWTSAELLVRTFDNDTTKALIKTLVDECIEVKDFGRAHRLVKNYNLHTDYPDIDTLYSRDGLLRLIEKKRWQLALTFAGSDATLQNVLLEQMVAAGEFQHVKQLATRMGLSDFEVDASQITTQCGKSEIEDTCSTKEYLSMSLDHDKVLFCDREEHIQEAINHFFGDHNEKATGYGETTKSSPFGSRQVVGLDVEWKPITARAAQFDTFVHTAIASILQIASSSNVFIIDLLALHDNDFLFDDFLWQLLTSERFLKVGFGFHSDLRGTRRYVSFITSNGQTFPERAAFNSIYPFVEISTAIFRSFGTSAGNSLSHATNRLLGKPLDKRMQLSNWDNRPLSYSQLEYAALDAFCLVQMTEACTVKNVNTDLATLEENLSACIQELTHDSPLSEEMRSEAIAYRKQYRVAWLEEINQRNSTPGSSLSTMIDVQRYWNQQYSSYASRMCNAGELPDLDLKFLPVATIKELLKQGEESGKTQNFLPVNSICFFANGSPSVACIDSRSKLDVVQLALLCNVSRRKLRLATATECEQIFGFSPGTVPPFGHRSCTTTTTASPAKIRIYADKGLQSAKYLAAGSGSHTMVSWLRSSAFFTLIDIEKIGDFALVKGSSGRSTNVEDYTDSKQNDSFQDTKRGDDEFYPEHKFLCDSMVAQVGRWLRTIGVDVITWDPAKVSTTGGRDHKSMMLALAAKEDRILLTRDTQLVTRRDAGACFLLSDDACYKQFREIKTQFGLYERKEERTSRCARCNCTEFTTVDIDFVRNQTKEEIHPKVLKVVTNYWMCNDCEKIYWEGPKYTTAVLTENGVFYRPTERNRRQRHRRHQLAPATNV